MFLRRPGAIALLSFIIATIMFVRPARAAQPGPMYWVCSYDTRTKPTSMLYVSDVTGPFGQRMRNNYTNTVLANEFSQFLHDTYKVAGAGSCSGYESVAKAQEAIKKLIEYAPSAKLVDTHWKSTAPAEAAAGALQGYCFAYTNQNFFVTRPFLYGRDNAQDAQGVNEEFSDFLVKKYGVPAGTSSRCASLRDPQLVANARQNEINDSKRIPRLQMVEFDWAPSPKAAPGPQKPAPAVAAPSPPPPAAAPARPPAPPQSADTFSFCSAYGTPQGPGNGKPRKQHYYVTALFARAATDRPDGDWQKFIRAAHTDEAFNASCTPPAPRATTEQRRTEQLASMKKLANFDVVDVDWKK